MAFVYVNGIPIGADQDNHLRFVLPFYEELAAGNIFPAWLAESNNGFGDLRFRFYPPMLYYAWAMFQWLLSDWYASTVATLTAASVIGSLGMYVWCREALTPKASVLAALIFAFVPYHLAQLYQASLYAEFAGTSLLPWAFGFTARLMRGSGRQVVNVAGLAMAFALIVTTHIPTTVVGSLSLGIYTLLLTDWKQRKWSLPMAAAAIGFGLVLSSWFWIKVVTEMSWIQAGSSVGPLYYDYRNNFLFSPFSTPHLNTWYGGYVAVLTIMIVLPALVLIGPIFKRKKRLDIVEPHVTNGTEPAAKFLRAALITGAVAFLMTTDISRPVWLLVPKLPSIQFPYRWLAVLSVMACPLAALALQVWWVKIARREIQARHLPVLLAFAAAVFLLVSDLLVDAEYRSHAEFTSRLSEIRGARSFNDWLPVGAAEMKDLIPMDGPIDAGGRLVISSQVGTHERRFTIAAGEPTDVRIRAYHYPLWKAEVTTAAGTPPTETKKAPDGTLLVAIPADSCELTVRFR